MRPYVIAAALFISIALTACVSGDSSSAACRQAPPHDFSNMPPADEGAPYSVPTYLNCPANVAEVLVRDERCTLWYGEEKFHRDFPGKGSAAKRRHAASVMKSLRCDTIDDEIRVLQEQYRYDPSIQRVLDNASIGAIN